MADDAYPEDKLWEMMDDIKVAMLTTMKGDRMESRPMHAFVDRDSHAIWFLTKLETEKTQEVDEHSPVNLGFVDKDDDSYVSVSGNAQVIRDVAKQKELWNPFAEAWMPEGPEAPTTGLIKVTPVDATLWDAPSSKLVKMFQVAAANITQRPPKQQEVHHVKL